MLFKSNLAGFIVIAWARAVTGESGGAQGSTISWKAPIDSTPIISNLILKTKPTRDLCFWQGLTAFTLIQLLFILSSIRGERRGAQETSNCSWKSAAR